MTKAPNESVSSVGRNASGCAACTHLGAEASAGRTEAAVYCAPLRAGRCLGVEFRQARHAVQGARGRAAGGGFCYGAAGADRLLGVGQRKLLGLRVMQSAEGVHHLRALFRCASYASLMFLKLLVHNAARCARSVNH